MQQGKGSEQRVKAPQMGERRKHYTQRGARNLLSLFLFRINYSLPSPGISGLFYNYQPCFPLPLVHTHTHTHTRAPSRSPLQATLLLSRRFEGVGGSQGFFARCSFPTADCGIARTLQGTLCQLSLKACRGVGEDLHTAQAGPDLNPPLC